MWGACVCVQEHWHTYAHAYAAMWVPKIEAQGPSPESPTLFRGQGQTLNLMYAVSPSLASQITKDTLFSYSSYILTG